MSENTTKACPTQAGSFEGYLAEYKVPKETKWKRIPTVQVSDVRIGVAKPAACGGVLQQMHLQGYEEAMAHAWAFMSQAAAAMDIVNVRVVPYRIHYDIKCYEQEHEAELVSDKSRWGEKLEPSS